MKNKVLLDDLSMRVMDSMKINRNFQNHTDVLEGIKYLRDRFTDIATDYEHFNDLAGEKPPEKIKVTINPSKLETLTNEALVDEMGQQISRVIFSRMGTDNKEISTSFRTLEARFRELALNHEALCGEEPAKTEEMIRMNVAYVHDANVEAIIIAQNSYGSTIRFTSTINGSSYLEYVKNSDIEIITKGWWPIPRKS